MCCVQVYKERVLGWAGQCVSEGGGVCCVQVYKERVLDVTVNCAQEAAKSGVKRFVEVSTAQIYDCDKVQ